MGGRKSMMQAGYGKRGGEMDLGQRGVMQTEQSINQSINHYVLGKEPEWKAVVGRGGTEERIWFVKFFWFIFTCILQPGSEIIGWKMFIVRLPIYFYKILRLQNLFPCRYKGSRLKKVPSKQCSSSPRFIAFMEGITGKKCILFFFPFDCKATWHLGYCSLLLYLFSPNLCSPVLSDAEYNLHLKFTVAFSVKI